MNAVDQCYGNPHHQYESIDFASNHSSRRLKRAFFICVVYSALLIAGIVTLGIWQNIQVTETNDLGIQKVMHITDSHIDLFFDPMQSVTRGGCHSCTLAKYASSSPPTLVSSNSSFECPLQKDIELYIAGTKPAQEHYLFGRYGCDPPLMLWNSLLAAMQLEDPSPSVVVFSGKVCERLLL
jgi:hypothetical protein